MWNHFASTTSSCGVSRAWEEIFAAKYVLKVIWSGVVWYVPAYMQGSILICVSRIPSSSLISRRTPASAGSPSLRNPPGTSHQLFKGLMPRFERSTSFFSFINRHDAVGLEFNHITCSHDTHVSSLSWSRTRSLRRSPQCGQKRRYACSTRLYVFCISVMHFGYTFE